MPAPNAIPLNCPLKPCCCPCVNDGPGVGLCALGRFGTSDLVFNLSQYEQRGCEDKEEGGPWIFLTSTNK